MVFLTFFMLQLVSGYKFQMIRYTYVLTDLTLESPNWDLLTSRNDLKNDEIMMAIVIWKHWIFKTHTHTHTHTHITHTTLSIKHPLSHLYFRSGPPSQNPRAKTFPAQNLKNSVKLCRLKPFVKTLRLSFDLHTATSHHSSRYDRF